MVSFRHWLSSLTTTGSQRSRRAQRKVKTGRTWIAQGVERLESRAMFACLPPTDLALAPTNIDENMAAGSTIGQFSTTDPDSSGPFKYSFQGGPQNLDNENFFLTGDVIKARTGLNFESISSYQVSIKTTDSDGHSFSKIFTIGVNDLQEAPVATADSVLTTENTPVSGNVLENDSDPEGDALIASLASGPANGTVDLAADGSFTYTPNAEYIGSDSFTYTADDGNGGIATATVSIIIDSLNDAPVAGNDAFSTDEDVPVSGNVLVNDTDADGDSVSTTLDTAPANGTVEMNSDGSFTYTPSANFNGEDSFTYIVDDGQGGTATGTVAISIAAVNDAPVAGNDDFTTDEDVPLTGNVLTNDSDVEGDSLIAALAEGPSNGVVEMNSDGSFTYTPSADFNGTDSFTYTVDDGQGGSAIGTVSITVTAMNDVPVATNDELVTDEDMPASGNVLSNDTDADGDSLTAALQDGPTSGTVEMNADGSFTYTPNADFNGSDSFTYLVEDGQGGSSVGTVAITVNAVNDVPIAVTDEAVTDEDMPVSGNVLANDTDADGDSLTAALQDGPANGSVELNSDGSFTYTPSADFNGSDSFTYVVDDGQGGTAVGTVAITVNAINDAPVAVNDEAVTDEDMPVSGNVLTNDTDADGDSLTAALQDGPASGTVELNSDGSFTYTPNADFNGSDSFTYLVEDGQGGSSIGTVSITVNAANDAPIAVNDELTTDEDMPGSGNVLTNDTDADGDSLTAALQDGPTSGTVELNSDGSFTYTPNADFNGSDSFTYLVEDGQGGSSIGTVSITVNAANDAPIAVNDELTTDEDMPGSGNVLTNDTDADGDSLTAALQDGPTSGTVEMNADGSFTYTPNADFNGSDSFTYLVEDGQGGSSIGTVSITVNAANDAPIAVNDELTTDEDMPVSGNVLTNDTDADGDSLTAALQDGPTSGTVELNSDGSFTYTPSADSNGSDSFTYLVDDGQGGTATGTVTITINAVNDAPVAADDQFFTQEDMPVSGDVLLNDSDVDGDSLTAELADGPTSGTVEMNSDGSFTYTPNADFSGADTFTYTLSDGNGGTAVGTVTIVVGAANDDPTASDDAFTTNEDVAAVIPIADLLANDGDVDGELPLFVAAGGAINGTVEVIGDNVVFTPAEDFNGTGSFEYAVQDGNGGFAFAKVTITVEPVADAPVANNDSVSTEQGVPLTVPASSLLANDTDADGDALSVVAVGGATGGTVSLVDGNVTFTPNADFTGTGSFHYIVSDGTGHHALGQVVVEVTPGEVENRSPVASPDNVIAAQDTPAMIAAADLLANDFDADGDVLSIIGVADAVGGSVEMVDDQITFTPDAGVVGPAAFTYTISDGRGGTATGTVLVNVIGAPENPPPTGGGDDDDCDDDSDEGGVGNGNSGNGNGGNGNSGNGNSGNGNGGNGNGGNGNGNGGHHHGHGAAASREALSLRMLLSRRHR